jgi:hypothetical protein
MLRILWLRRHNPWQAHVDALQTHFGDAAIVQSNVKLDIDPSLLGRVTPVMHGVMRQTKGASK